MAENISSLPKCSLESRGIGQRMNSQQSSCGSSTSTMLTNSSSSGISCNNHIEVLNQPLVVYPFVSVYPKKSAIRNNSNISCSFREFKSCGGSNEGGRETFQEWFRLEATVDCLSEPNFTSYFSSNNILPKTTSKTIPTNGDIRQQVVKNIMQYLPDVIRKDAHKDMDECIANTLFHHAVESSKPVTERPKYCIGTRCEHVEHWRRLRAKKGQIYYVCCLCGAKWRIPTRNTLMAKILKDSHTSNSTVTSTTGADYC